MDIKIHQPRFRISEVSAATEVPATTIRQWYARGVWNVGPYDKEPETFGQARLFSIATAIGLKITKVLSDKGVPTKFAAHSSMEFAHRSGKNRDQGRLFKDGETFLIICDQASLIVNIKHNTSFTNLLEELPARGDQSLIHMLPLDALVIEVIDALGIYV